MANADLVHDGKEVIGEAANALGDIGRDFGL